MKVVILSTFFPYRGGIAQFNACLLRELEKNGHEVKAYNFSRQYPSVLFPGKTQYVADEDTADPVENLRSLDSVGIWSWFKTVKFISEERPDLVLIRYWTPFLAPALGFISGKLRGKGIKVIAITDNVVPHEKNIWDRMLSQYFLKRIDGFLAMTKEVAKQIHSITPVLRGIVMPHPVYEHFGKLPARQESRDKFHISSDKKVVLFFGLIREYKGLDILIEAFGLLDESYVLLIGGESYGEFSKYEALIQKSKNKSRILVFNRYIPDAEVPSFFGAADVTVLPYRSATQSGITAVSFHFGVPVIATNVGGLAEVIEDGYNGIISKSPDSSEIAANIEDFFRSFDAVDYHSNMEATRKKFSWSGFVEALLKFSASLG